MIIKSKEITVLKYSNNIKEALDKLKNSKFSIIPVVDEFNKYFGVFDRESITKVLYEKIPIESEIKDVVNKDFPTILSDNISDIEYFQSNKEPYLVVIDSGGGVKGLLRLFEDNDFFNLLNDSFFNRLLDSISDGILICDKDFVVRKINKAYTDLTGVSSDEIEGLEVSKVRKGAQIPTAVSSGKVMKNIYRKVGNTEYFVDLYPIKINNEVLGGIVLAKDMTEVQNLTKKISDLENKFYKLKASINAHHRADKSFEQIITINDKMKECIEIAKKVASNDSNIIIRGESGTGKEVFAQAIHNYSYRRDNPFVAINSAAIEPNLVLSELFGYEDGAFTGAIKGGKMGVFEIANKGTLFLDEIGDLDFELQSKLLRVLENSEITRVGGHKNIKIDVRIISATHVNLEESVENKKFRADLYFRLNVIPITLPPLRERKEDIPYLVDYLLKNIEKKFQKNINIDNRVIDAFLKYNWPGNIRELQNILTFAANMVDDHIINMDHIPLRIIQNVENINNVKEVNNSRSNITDIGNLNNAKAFSERNEIIKALDKYGKSLQGKRKAAASLQISLSTLYNKINQYNLK